MDKEKITEEFTEDLNRQIQSVQKPQRKTAIH